jgi:hypothetical protein
MLGLFYFWILCFIGYFYVRIEKLHKKLNIAIDALRKISSTDYDMNKLVVIAIKALKDIDKV